MSLTAFLADCRPETEQPPATIDVEETDDEFIIKKPTSTDQKYDDFIKELYRKDENKQGAKSKRNAPAEVPLTVESPNEYEIPSKPLNTDGQYDDFLSELYRHDELKKRSSRSLKRSRRMIVFRQWLFNKIMKKGINCAFSFLFIILGRCSFIRKKKFNGPRQTADDEFMTMTTPNNDTIYLRYSWRVNILVDYY